MTLFEKMNYDEETCKILTHARYKTGLVNASLVILHENVKAGNMDFIEKVNDFIENECTSTKEANDFIQKNNEMKIANINV